MKYQEGDVVVLSDRTIGVLTEWHEQDSKNPEGFWNFVHPIFENRRMYTAQILPHDISEVLGKISGGSAVREVLLDALRSQMGEADLQSQKVEEAKQALAKAEEALAKAEKDVADVFDLVSSRVVPSNGQSPHDLVTDMFPNAARIMAKVRF